MASIFNLDKEGFLVGQRLMEESNDLLTKIERNTRMMARGVALPKRSQPESLRDGTPKATRPGAAPGVSGGDTRTAQGDKARAYSIMADAMERASRSSAPARGGKTGMDKPVVARPKARGFAKTQPLKAVQAQASVTAKPKAKSAGKSGAASTPHDALPDRNTKGQFVAGMKRPGSNEASERAGIAGFIGKLTDAVGGVGRGGDGLEGLDPTLKAMHEVKDMLAPVGMVAKPLARGFGLLKKKPEEKQVGLLSRILDTLKLGRKDAQRNAKPSRMPLPAKRLGGILGAGGGNDSPLGSGLMAGLSGAAGGLATSALGMMKKGAGTLLKRLPFIGALIEGGASAFDFMEASNDKTLTDEQRHTKQGAVVGRGGGAISGAMAGAALGAIGGPIGIAIGGVVGGIAGAFFGEKLGAALGEPAVKAYQAVVQSVSNAMTSIDKFVTETWAKGVEAFTSVWTGIKAVAEEKFNVLKDIFTAIDGFLKKFVPGYEGAKQAVTTAVEAGKTAVKNTAQAVSNGASAVTEYVGERTDKASEFGKSLFGNDRVTKGRERMNRQMDSMGITDPKERANFMAQVEHENGGYKFAEEGLNYKSVDKIRATFGKNKAIAGMSDEEVKGLVNNPEALANKVYGGRMGNTEAGDGYKYRGRGDIQLTGKDNYDKAGKALGIDLVSNPDALKDPDVSAKVAGWYWKTRVQSVGAQGDVEAARKAINGGTNGMADTKTRLASIEASGAAAVTTTATAAANPGTTVAATGKPAMTVPTAPVTVASASAPSIKPPAVVSPAPAVEVTPPTQVTQLNTPGDTKVIATVAPAKAGRDVDDRRLAHIVTGGLSQA